MAMTIGTRIKDIREQQGLSQEYVAQKLDTTRKKYARIENGQLDLSYTLIKEISEVFGVPTEVITSALDEDQDLVASLRENNHSALAEEAFKKVVTIIETFYAHGKLYDEKLHFADQYIAKNK